MTGILGQLKWESLEKRSKYNKLILSCKGLKGKARIPTDDLISKFRRSRNQHPMTFQILDASKDVYKNRFFLQTIRDRNYLSDSLFSFAELSCVYFGTNFPQVLAPGEGLSLWCFTSKIFRFRSLSHPPRWFRPKPIAACILYHLEV